MNTKVLLLVILTAWQQASFALPLNDMAKPAVPMMNASAMLNWSGALVLVLAIFILCVFLFKKFNGITGQSGKNLAIVSGIALGMREKVVLLQVGKKQVLLAVMPGKIETLLVLEGEDCISNEPMPSLLDNGFAEKLMQALKVRSDATL